MSEIITHKCPFCGGTLEFDIGVQKVKCPYCDSEFEPEELKKNEGDLEVDDFELAEDAGSEWSEKELYGLSEYQCDSCGGDLYTDSNTAATVCPYCGSAVMLKGRLSGTLKPDRVIPFKRTREEAIEGLGNHTGSKWFVPKSFLANNKLEEIKGLYVPFWIYDAELDAEVVYNCVNETTWTVGKTEYTERKYYRVTRGGSIAFDHVPVDGSQKMPDDLMESIEPFDYDKSEDFTTGYLSGYVAERYDVDQEQARPRARKRMAEGTADAFRRTVHYDEVSVNDISIEPTSSNVNYVLYPVWLMNTVWGDKKFTFAMNGQTGKIVGNLPADKVKLYGVSSVLFILLLAFGFIAGNAFPEDLGAGGIILGLIVGAISFFGFSQYFLSRLKTVEFQHGASVYYRENSMNVDLKRDEFLYKRVTTRRLE